MKKLGITLIIFLFAFHSFGQTIQPNLIPNFQQFGSRTTWTRINGVIYPFAGLVNAEYADTASANASIYKVIPGLEIRVGNKKYMRNTTATGWVEIGNGSSEPAITAPMTTNKYWNGYKQFVLFDSDSVLEGASNLYFTNARSRSALSFTFTTTGSSGAATGTYNSGTGAFAFNIPQYAAASGSSSANSYIRNTGATGEPLVVAINDSTIGIKKLIEGLYVDLTGADSSVTVGVDSATMFPAIRATISGGGGSSAIPVDSLNGWSVENTVMAGNVFCGTFWPANKRFYNFFWQVLAVPYPGCEYWISDDWGGAHNLLFGMDGGTSTLGISGNIQLDGTTLTSFNSIDKVQDSTLHYFAVGWDGSFIVTYIDGVPSSKLAVSGYRLRNTGLGELFLFGSDHSNAYGKMLSVIGYEDACPVLLTRSYTPRRNVTSAIGNLAFYMDFSQPAQVVPDHSSGFFGMKHTGQFNDYAPLVEPMNGSTSGLYSPPATGGVTANQPRWVKTPFAKPAYTGPTPSVPGGAIQSDEFNRVDKTPAWDESGIDSTEGGTIGKKIWKLGAGVNGLGILSQHVWIDTDVGTYVYVDSVGTSDQDVRLTRDNGSSNLTVYARYTDVNNHVVAATHTDGNTYLSKVVAGVTTSLGNAATGVTPTEIKVIVSGSTASVYINGTLKVTGSCAGVPTGNTGAGWGVYDDLGRAKKFEIY